MKYMLFVVLTDRHTTGWLAGSQYFFYVAWEMNNFLIVLLQANHAGSNLKIWFLIKNKILTSRPRHRSHVLSHNLVAVTSPFFYAILTVQIVTYPEYVYY